MPKKPAPIESTIDSALKSLAEDGKLPVRINGNCMQPLIQDGALVSIRKQKRYWPGDILVKRCGTGQLVAHRLVGAYPRNGLLNFVTKADNVEKADAAVSGAHIIGRISGGDCKDKAIHIPLLDRLKSFGHFMGILTQHLSCRLLGKR